MKINILSYINKIGFVEWAAQGRPYRPSENTHLQNIKNPPIQADFLFYMFSILVVFCTVLNVKVPVYPI